VYISVNFDGGWFFTIVNEGRLISDKTRIKQWKGKGWIPDRRNPSKMKVSYNWPFTEDYWYY
jgi:lipocalin